MMKFHVKKLCLLPALMVALGLTPASRATAQDLTALYNFPQISTGPVWYNRDGAWPWAGLLLSGNVLYGTTVTGGSKACGTLFSIQTDGSVFTNLYTFSDTSNPQAEYPKSGLILVNNLLCGADYTVERRVAARFTPSTLTARVLPPSMSSRSFIT